MSTIFLEIAAAQARYEDWAALHLDGASQLHIAVMAEPFLSAVLSGQKTVESRFSLHKIAPYKKVEPGDLIFMKAGPIVGCFTAAWVEDYDLAYHPIGLIRQAYGKAIGGDETFWRQKSQKRYTTLIGISKVQRLTPLLITKRDRRAWVVKSTSGSA